LNSQPPFLLRDGMHQTRNPGSRMLVVKYVRKYLWRIHVTLSRGVPFRSSECYKICFPVPNCTNLLTCTTSSICSCVTGVLGPHSNAHGPNEFLDIEYCKRVVTCVSVIIKEHAYRGEEILHIQPHSGKQESAESRIAGAAEDKLVQQKLK